MSELAHNSLTDASVPARDHAQPKKRGRPKDRDLAERRREAILEAAGRLFARVGFARSDLDELASELGVGKGTLYRYFPTKSELFLAAVDRAMRALHAEIAAAAESASDPLDQIAQAV